MVLLIYYKHQVSLLSTAHRAKMLIGLITACGLVLSSFPLWTVSVARNKYGLSRCLVIRNYSTAYHDWNTAVLRVGTLALPGVIMTQCTIMIVVRLTAAARKRLVHAVTQVGN